MSNIHQRETITLDILVVDGGQIDLFYMHGIGVDLLLKITPY
jgi:hypothetical protein